MTTAEYEELLNRGYRRFGWQVFRPACRTCTQCRSLRVPVQRWQPSASDARVLRKNQTIQAELHPLFVTHEHIQLFNRYHNFMHQHRGWPLHTQEPEGYRDEFLSGAANVGSQWLYFERDRLIGVALMDQALTSISLVYFYYDPDWRSRSPGTFSILNQLLYARSRGMNHAYLGYWIEDCPSMSYKRRFRPHEILTEYPDDQSHPVWV